MARPQSWTEGHTNAAPWSDSSYPLRCMAFTTVASVSCVGVLVVPNVPAGDAVWVAVLLVALGIAILTALLCTNQVDPGVIPPTHQVDSEVQKVKDKVESSVVSKDDQGRFVRVATDKYGRQVTERYCTTCNVWKPPFASHCSVCGYCMQRFDHHCSIVGTCIARNNHRWFLCLLLLAGPGCVLCLVGCIWAFVRLEPAHASSWKSEHHWSLYPLLLAMLGFAYGGVLLSCFGFAHCAMLLGGTTTKATLTGVHGAKSGSVALAIKVWVCELWSIACAPLRWKWAVTRSVRARTSQVHKDQQGEDML